MTQLARDLAEVIDRRRALGAFAMGIGGAALAACGSRAGASDSGMCIANPAETAGPFPANGTGGFGRRRFNVLDTEGIVRRDIRPSFAGMQGEAEGVSLELEIAVAETGGSCGPLPGYAVYLWQNDAAGAYSLYDLREANYLRGLQETDAEGKLRFTAIVPGCYGGRYPHCHFEVYRSAAAAAAGEPSLLVSQFAFPEAECRAIYESDARYGESLRNLQRQPIARDFVFADASPVELAAQSIALTGDPQSGYRGAVTVAL